MTRPAARDQSISSFHRVAEGANEEGSGTGNLFGGANQLENSFQLQMLETSRIPLATSECNFSLSLNDVGLRQNSGSKLAQ